VYRSLGWSGEIISELQRPPATRSAGPRLPSHLNLHVPFLVQTWASSPANAFRLIRATVSAPLWLIRAWCPASSVIVILPRLMPLRVMLCSCPEVLLAPKPAPAARLAWVAELEPAAGFSIFASAGVARDAETAGQADAAGYVVAVIFNTAFRQRAGDQAVEALVYGGLAAADHRALELVVVFDEDLEAAIAGMDGGLFGNAGEIAGSSAIAVMKWL